MVEVFSSANTRPTKKKDAFKRTLNTIEYIYFDEYVKYDFGRIVFGEQSNKIPESTNFNATMISKITSKTSISPGNRMEKLPKKNKHETDTQTE